MSVLNNKENRESKMKKGILIKVALLLLATLLLMVAFTSCKTGKDSIAENDSLAKILGTGAAGMSGTRGDVQVADLPNVDHANIRSNASEGVYYFKLVDGTETIIEPGGEYTVGMADKRLTVKVKDADGNEVQSVTIEAQGEKSLGNPIKEAAAISVPKGGSVISIGGDCVAQLRE